MHSFKIKLFADGADLDEMLAAHRQRMVDGFTTNPTLMRKAGVADYESFARRALEAITDLPISFEVFADEFPEMETQAKKIGRWGKNVYVKIPVTNTRGEPSYALIQRLTQENVKVNVTAILTLEQVKRVAEILAEHTPAIVSVFAGRIADTGRDPMPIMHEARSILASSTHAELLWASSRELLNIVQAEACECHIITVTKDILNKLPMVGKGLAELSLDTVKMFYTDAVSAGFKIV